MTNDGAFANAMMHPARHVPKTYRVTVHPGVTEEMLAQMETGMVIDGRKTAPARVRVLTEEKGRVVLEIILYEGRNRQIRNMCEQLGLEVARLRRIAMGSVRLGMLPPGKWRELTAEEVRRLKDDAKAKGQAEKKEGGTPDDYDSSCRGRSIGFFSQEIRRRSGIAGHAGARCGVWNGRHSNPPVCFGNPQFRCFRFGRNRTAFSPTACFGRLHLWRPTGGAYRLSCALEPWKDFSQREGFCEKEGQFVLPTENIVKICKD